MDVLDVWGMTPGKASAHVKGCHRLIKDPTAKRGRLTLQSYLHNFQPEGCEVEPQWGHFYLKPKGARIKETGVNEFLCPMIEVRHQDCTSIIWVWTITRRPRGFYTVLHTSLLLVYYCCYYWYLAMPSVRGPFWGKNNKLFRQKVVIQKLQNFSFQK